MIIFSWEFDHSDMATPGIVDFVVVLQYNDTM